MTRTNLDSVDEVICKQCLSVEFCLSHAQNLLTHTATFGFDTSMRLAISALEIPWMSKASIASRVSFQVLP